MTDHDDVNPICVCGQSSTGDPCKPGTTQGEPPTENSHCPKCGSEIGSGYGLAYGGMGMYYFCDGEQECDWFYKVQDAEE